jgi:DNA-binding NtrC family response regulator
MDEKVNKIRLLMVDDEEEFLTSSTRALSRRGFDVTVAPNGVTALEKIEQEEFDVVVLDVLMPDIDGIEVFRQIREKLPALPVILLTGRGSVEDAFQTSKEGVADYLSKPIEVDELARRVQEIVAEFRSQEPAAGESTGPVDRGEPIRAMLVDDEVEFLASLERVLRRRNMNITTAESGEKALRLLKESLVDVVVLDVKMPGMDGLEVLRRIKEGFPSVEVILLTGYPSVEAALEAIKLGANEYMKKPPEVDELAATIRRLYENRQNILLERQKKLMDEIRRRYPD